MVEPSAGSAMTYDPGRPAGRGNSRSMSVENTTKSAERREKLANRVTEQTERLRREVEDIDRGLLNTAAPINTADAREQLRELRELLDDIEDVDD